ncbi:hypothetical protein ACS0TY_022204 [Phlomoides rotata]
MCRHHVISLHSPTQIGVDAVRFRCLFSDTDRFHCLFSDAFHLFKKRLAIMASERLLILQPHDWVSR